MDGGSRSRSDGRGRRRLILRGALFVLPILGVWAGCEAGLSTVDHTIYSARKDVLARRSGDIRVLFLGNSQVLVGIRPEFLTPPAFNLAHNAQDSYYNRQLVQRFGGDMKRLELVVIGVSYFTLESRLSQNPERWRQCFFYRFYGLPHQDEPSEPAHWADVSYVALYGREESAKLAFRGFRSRREKMDESGWPMARLETTPPDAMAEQGLARIGRHHSFMIPENLPYNVAQLEALIEGLSARNVGVAFFSPPLTEAYRVHLRPEAVNRSQDALKALGARRSIPYLDYTADPRFLPTDFKDADHLNPRGAEKLTRLLDLELIGPLFRQTR